MNKTFKKITASLMAISTLAVGMVGVGANAADSSCTHYGSVSTFKTTCSNTTPYHVTAQITIKSDANNARYTQTSFYAGSSISDLVVITAHDEVVSPGKSAEKMDRTNLRYDYIRCYGHVYTSGSPHGPYADSYACDVVKNGNVAI